MIEDDSRSSFVSDWTKGLVGGLRTKLDENEEDNDGAPDRQQESDIDRDAKGRR